MNWIDLVLIILLGLSVLFGLWRGILKTVLLLAGLIAGIALAGRFYASLASHLPIVPQGNAARAIAFALIVIAVLVVAYLLAIALKKMLSWLWLGWLDHLAGAVLGLALGAFSLGALLGIMARFSFLGLDEAIASSRLASVLVSRLPLLLALLPSEFESLRTFFH